MYRIAIVEDTEQDARLLMSTLDKYAEQKHVQIEYEWISSAARFLEDYRGQYGIVLFDIRMPGLDGMSAARELRAVDRTVVIAFLTSLAQYAVEGYAVDAVDFILKPITYAALELKLPRILSRCHVDELEILIQSNELQYAEIYDHHIQFLTTNGIIRSYGTLKEVEALLPDGFFRINNQTIVNLRFVRHVDSQSAVVAGRSFPISRGRRKEFLAALHGAICRPRT